MFALCLQCKDQPGIVAAVATALAENRCNIEESSQFFDHFSGRFFMRLVFTPLQAGSLEKFKGRFEQIAVKFQMEWALYNLQHKTRTLILVSKADHCLHDLLYRSKTDTLDIEITGIVSNHADLKPLADGQNLPFHHIPVTADNKADAEQRLQQIIDKNGVELILLARYMQVLSQQFCSKNEGRIINIHHSFLPGFKGAKPYHQAYERGVKIIGATAHFVTSDLDEGPIIAQGIEAVDHAQTPEKMQQTGRHIESRVLSDATRLYAERRIFLHGHRTVIL